MTRKEQILNEAVDYSFVEENFIEYDDCGDVCDDRDFIQKAFEEGAKWADETMIEKAYNWLDKHAEEYTIDGGLAIECLLHRFKQDMKNE